MRCCNLNFRRRNLVHTNKTAVTPTIVNDTTCCQSMWEITPLNRDRNRDFTIHIKLTSWSFSFSMRGIQNHRMHFQFFRNNWNWIHGSVLRARRLVAAKEKEPKNHFGPQSKIWRQPTLAEAIQPLPSARLCLTAEFGMGSGRTTALWPPKNLLKNTGFSDNYTQEIRGTQYH